MVRYVMWIRNFRFRPYLNVLIEYALGKKTHDFGGVNCAPSSTSGTRSA